MMSDREQTDKWVDLVYLPAGHVTHLLCYADNTRLTYPRYWMHWGKAMCGQTPGLNSEWLGTGSYSQMVEAHRQRLCKHCEALAIGR